MHGTTAAPNESTLVGEVLSISEPDSANKYHIRIQVTEVNNHYGPCFARKGDSLECFTFAKVEGLSVSNTVTVKAEFLGGPTRQLCQLKSIELI